MEAKYTVLLKTLMDYPETNEKLQKALSTYPVFQYNGAAYVPQGVIPTREEINEAILRRYKYREIGFETPGRFFDELEATMLEIMPYYNQQMNTVAIMAELPSPFDNVDVIETIEDQRTREISGTDTEETESTNTGSASNTTNSTDEVTSGASSSSTNTGSSSSNTDTTAYETGKTVKSETPQDALTITAKEIDTVPYADEVNWSDTDNNTSAKNTSSNTDTTSSSSESETSGEHSTTSNSENSASGSESKTGTRQQTETETYSHTYKKLGNQGVNTYAHDMTEFRETLLNIKQMIITDPRIAELFMLVY